MAILYFHEDYGGQMECCFLLNFKNQMGTVLTLQYEKCIIQNYFNNHFCPVTRQYDNLGPQSCLLF